MRTKGFGDVLGAITRYTLAVVACVSLAQSLLLIGVGTEKARELVVETGGRAIIFGAVAAYWFYEHRRKKQLILGMELLLQATKLAEPLQAKEHSQSSGSPKAILPSLAEPWQPEATPPAREVNVHAVGEQSTETPDAAGADRNCENTQLVSGIVAEPDGAKTMRQIAILVGLVLVFLFGWLVWPTPYRYDTIGTAHIPIRIDRLTGEAERLTGEGWVRLAPPPPETPCSDPLAEVFRKSKGLRDCPE